MYDMSIMASARRAFQADKDRRDALLAQRTQEVYSRLPRVEEIDRELRVTVGKLMIAAFENETDPQMANRGMSVIISEASRLNEMVEELLDFSRMSSGRMKLNIERIDVLAELDEVVFAFKERAAKNGLEIIYNVPQIPAPATADASRMRQVFINVLDNAVKYTEHGGKIAVQAEIPNPATLVVTFSDTGIGISEDDLPHIKEKFYKVDSTIRGSGIGLAVVDEIIKLHGGEFEIASIYGEGTTVKITLPLTPAEFITEQVDNSEGERPYNE